MRQKGKIENFGRMIDLIIERYNEIESTLPLLSRELSSAERKTLKKVAQMGSVAVGDIGKSLGMPASTTTWIVGGLVKRDIFKKVQDKNDRRKYWISLTDKGSALSRLMERIPDRIANDILYKFSDDDKARFLELVEGTIEKIETDLSII